MLVCGLHYLVPPTTGWTATRKYLPQVAVSAHTSIQSTVSRTTLKQTFVNPSDKLIDELRYTFPLFDGVSVVGFTFTINKTRIVKGVVKEKQKARQDYQKAVDEGKTAGLFEQSPDAGDVFTTSIGNVPAGAEIVVDITYLGELQHDAEIDGVRLTIPTVIAPRYGNYPGELLQRPTNVSAGGIEIVVDAEMPTGCNIKSVQSPSHPISVSIGNVSTATSKDEMSLSKASATLALGSAELDKDFVLLVAAPDVKKPVAILESHPRYPSQRALMATLVPKFKIPESRPEIVFICDRSGSMGGGQQIPNLKAALNIFLKSLPVGIKFNICSFGSRFDFLFPEGSRSYDQNSMDLAVKHIETFQANYGGTEMHQPIEATFQKRYKDMDLEVFVLTDGEIWNQGNLFGMVNKQVRDSNGAIRLFTLGIGRGVSHSLIQGLARSGNGFSQAVADDEKMNNKVVKMLKAALTPHVTDYSLEVKYGEGERDEKMGGADDLDDFEIVEKTSDSLVIRTKSDTTGAQEGPKQTPISLFDESNDEISEDIIGIDDKDSKDAANKFAHVPPIDPPKILQSPINIPPLYPSSRTTVYLLLSPHTTQKVPKTVVYRGTSRHGPLELEIPVTALSEPGETIHQLAARAAVKELEEGRGWIYEAKAEDGKSLKEKFEGRFSDMVEREAARLGVQYQVGNKWCSFVAIDADSGKQEAQPKSRGSRAVDEDDLEDEEDCGFALFDAPNAVPGQSSRSRMAARPMAMCAAAPATMSASYAAPPPPAPSAFMPAMAQAAPLRSELLSEQSVRAGRGGPTLHRFAAASAKSMSRDRSVGMTTPFGPATSAGHSNSFQAQSLDFYKDAEVVTGAASDALQDLVSLQTFDGSWASSPHLLRLLGISESSLLKAFDSDGNHPVCSPDGMATAATVAFLKHKMADREDEWEMLVQKAISWLDGLGGALSGEELVKKATSLFVTQ